MDQQIILAVNDNGKFLEYIPKETGHKGVGKRHLAIAVLLQNSKGQVLLQKRKHQIFDNLWDITGATHPLHKPHYCHSERSEESVPKEIATSPAAPRNDKKCKICNQDDVDETLEEATKRCLAEEWGINEIRDIKILGEFNYFAKYNDFCENEAEPLFCENEHCAMIMGKYDGAVKINPEMGYEYKWMDKEEFLKDIEQNPKNYTPWAIKSLEFLKR